MDAKIGAGPWIQVIEPNKAEGRLEEVYREITGKRGRIARVHAIQSLHPEALKAHMDLYLELMFARSPLTRRQREMIGIAVSRANGCAYCVRHHADALVRYERRPDCVEAICEGRFGELDRLDAALCRHAEKLTRTPGMVSRADIDVLRAAGLEDAGVLALTEVAAYFNFVNRLVLGLGVTLEDPADREGFHY